MPLGHEHKGCAPAPAARPLGPPPRRSQGRCTPAVLRLATVLALAGVMVGSAWADPAGGEVAPGAGGALAVSAEPARIVLGKDAVAELRISTPADVEELSVTASAGKVESVRRLPAGGFVARYRPPPDRHPQVAIVAALGRTSAGALLDGWLAVPLSGRGDARVRGEPGSQVSVRIGDRTFGPARAGGDGVAVIPVVVPPGVREAHIGFTPLELKVPESTLILAVADRQAVQADRSEAVRVLVYVVAPHGAARKGDPPAVEVTRGALTLRPREPGAYEGTWNLPPGPAGEDRAAIKLEGFPISRAVLHVTAAPGPPVSVALSADRPVFKAGEVEEVQVTARGLDSSGNTAPGPLILSADCGTLSQEEVAPGTIRGRLRVEPRFQGRDRVLVTARAASTGATTVLPVALVPGPATRALLGRDRGYLRADGNAETVLTLEMRDAFDNPAVGSPSVTASAGPPPALELREPGRWRVRYRPAAVKDLTRARLVAELGEARSQSDLWLVPPSPAQVSFLAAGGGMGGVRSGLTGGQLLLGAELPLPEWMPLPPQRALGLRLELAGAAGSRGSGAERETQRTAAVLAGPVLKGLMPGGRWFASATAGVLLGSADGPDRPSRTGAGLAARLAFGVAVPVQRTAPFLELGFLGGGGPGGGVGALTLSLGVRFDGYRQVVAPSPKPSPTLRVGAGGKK